MSSPEGSPWGRLAGGFGLVPSTWRGRAVLVSGIVAFLVLDVLVVLGSELALGLLVILTGLVAGLVLAYLAVFPVRWVLERGGPENLLGFLVGVASTFAIVFVGTQAAGIPAYPTAEGGYLGTAIYGLAFGFGATVCGLSLRSPVRFTSAYRDTVPEDGTGRVWLKASFIIAGVVAGLFGLFFFASLMIEYVLAPIVRLLVS